MQIKEPQKSRNLEEGREAPESIYLKKQKNPVINPVISRLERKHSVQKYIRR